VARYLSKLFYVLSARKSTLLILLLTFIGISIIEAFGIGIIGPFILLAAKPALVHENYWINQVYERIGTSREEHFVALLGLFIVVVFCLKSLVSWYAQTRIFSFSYKLQGQMSTKLLHAYLGAPYTFYLKKNSADAIHGIITESRQFANQVLIPLLTTISNTTIILALTLLLCMTNLIAICAVLFMLIPTLLLFHKFRGKMALWSKQLHGSGRRMIKVINHALGGIKETKIIGCESFFEAQLAEQAKIFGDASGGFYSMRIAPRILIETLLVVFLIGFTSALLFTDQSLESMFAVLSVFALASIRLIPALTNVLNSSTTLRSSVHALNNLYLDLKELDEAQVELESRQMASRNGSDFRGHQDGSKTLANSNQSLSPAPSFTSDTSTSTDPNITYSEYLNSAYLDYLNGISTQGNLLEELQLNKAVFSKKIELLDIIYRYPNRSEDAISNVSLTINRGESVAFVGKSGAGKTTLVDIILGLLTPSQGDIKVDGQSIYGDIRAWQNLIGYIPQSIFLTDESVEENIAFGVGVDQVDPDRLEEAIRAAQLTDVVANLPKGVKTKVGERGIKLSGGQRQRVGIARAIYHGREILVLDEATAALDSETESLVTESIKSLSGTKTILIIAHRLTTIEHCDRVYLLDKGLLVKSGTYTEVCVNA
jgi:ATP-binding cassette, subfamily B, bacterial PglK